MLDAVVAAAPSAAQRATKPVTVVIKDLRLPQYLDRPQIVARNDGNRLEVNEFEQWGGPLREDMTRVLVTNLGRLLGGDRVVAAPYHMATLPDYRVEVDILGFERVPGGRVRLSAQWWVSRGADTTLVASSEGTFSGEPLAADVPYEKLVGSMSSVYGELAQAIARGIRPRGAGNS
ncbi:MAG: PqiC family protein [Rhodocyclaceae bacterium]|nr:PqiC family protein [Rhodocyclaceae bacterium]